jgi:hypothetical protein
MYQCPPALERPVRQFFSGFVTAGSGQKAP